ncbi:MAG: histidine kinase, partial [Pseudomonadales bacterium]
MTEAALAPNATPQPPSVILQLLEKLAVPYQVRAERPGLPAAARLQAVLLDDAVGALLVLYPRSQLLDLGRLAELTG